MTQQQPIQLYYWPTPNGHKISILLEELGLAYTPVAVDITRGDQFEPDFLQISPNNKIPAIVDPEGPGGEALSLFESGAIMIYLGEKTGRFIPQEPAAYYSMMQWLMFQMGGLGPMAGQAHHFRNYAPESIDYAITRYTNEVARLYRVLDRRLGESDYLAGDYSIADMAAWPWIKPYKRQGQDLAEYPHLQRWFKAIGERPAVQRALEVMADAGNQGKSGSGFDPKAQEILFGQAQYRDR